MSQPQDDGWVVNSTQKPKPKKGYSGAERPRHRNDRNGTGPRGNPKERNTTSRPKKPVPGSSQPQLPVSRPKKSTAPTTMMPPTTASGTTMSYADMLKVKETIPPPPEPEVVAPVVSEPAAPPQPPKTDMPEGAVLVGELEKDMSESIEKEPVKKKEPLVKAGVKLPAGKKKSHARFGGLEAPGDIDALVKAFDKRILTKEMEAEMQGLKDKCVKLENEVTNGRRKYEDVERRLADRSATLQKANEQVNVERDLKESLQQQVSDLQKKLEAAKAEISNFERVNSVQSMGSKVPEKSPAPNNQPIPPQQPMPPGQGYHNMGHQPHMMPYFQQYYPYQQYPQNMNSGRPYNMYEGAPPSNMPMQPHHPPQGGGGDYPEDFGRHNAGPGNSMNMRSDSSNRGRPGIMMDKMGGQQPEPPGLAPNQGHPQQNYYNMPYGQASMGFPPQGHNQQPTPQQAQQRSQANWGR